MRNQDLFIIIKALLWYSPNVLMPSDEEIMKFIKKQKEKLKDENKENY